MNRSEHINKYEISGYYAGTIPERQSQEIGRHLLSCETCRDQLPLPSVEDIMNALMKENETEDSLALEKSFWQSFQPFIPAFSLVTLTLIIGISLIYFLFNRAENTLTGQANMPQNQQSEVALLENKSQMNTLQQNPIENVQTPSLVKETIPPRASQKNILSKPQSQKRNELNKTQNDRREDKTIAAVRGNTDSSFKNKTDQINAQFIISGSDLKLTWSRFSEAANYSVVVADAESNNLIDEIKLKDETETSISLKKFEASKKYEVKVVATLPDGTIKTSKTYTFTKKLQKR